jgi:hypothetical protein
MLPSFKAPLLSKVGLRLSEEYGCRQYRPHRAFPLYLSSYLARRLFPRSQRSSAALTGASGVSASATMIQEIEFAPDSPLEGNVIRKFSSAMPRHRHQRGRLHPTVSGGSSSRRNSSIGLPRPTTARMIPAAPRVDRPNSAEASKPLLISRGTGRCYGAGGETSYQGVKR